MVQSLSKPGDPESTSEQAPTPSHRASRLRVLIPLGLLVGGAIAWIAITFWPRSDANSLELSGRLEGYPTDIDARVPGRVEAVTVREGDRVEQGEVIAQLDDEEIQAQLEAATASLSEAERQYQQAVLQLGVIESQIQEARLNVEQSQGDAAGRIYQSEANLATAQAQLAEAQAQAQEAQAQLELAQVDRDRFQQLSQQGAVPQQRYDQALTELRTAQAILQTRQATIEASRRQVNAAQGELAQARTTGFNPEIRGAQLEAQRRQLAVAQAQVQAAAAEVARAQAQRQEILAQVNDLSIISPIDGIVITRSVEPGTVVANGTTLLTVLDPSDVYLRGYIPEGEIGQVRVGQSALVYLDSNPGEPLTAQVASIDTEASFTPENIYFREDRVRQVFGVRLDLDRPAGFAKPGMPADAEILLDRQDEALAP